MAPITAEVPDLAAALWISVRAEVQVHKAGKKARKFAWDLVNGLGLEPGSGQRVPVRVLQDGRIRPLTKMAMRTILQKGQWSPTVLPYTGGEVSTGFELEERPYSRMVFLHYDPVHDDFRVRKEDLVGEDGQILYFWSPKDLNQRTEDSYHHKDRGIFKLAQQCKKRFCQGKASRMLVDRGSVGKPLYLIREDTNYRVEWAKQHEESFEEDIDYTGEPIHRYALAEDELEYRLGYDGFTWLPAYERRVLQLEPAACHTVYPRVTVNPDDFPEEIQDQHREFFSGWRRHLA